MLTEPRRRAVAMDGRYAADARSRHSMVWMSAICIGEFEVAAGLPERVGDCRARAGVGTMVAGGRDTRPLPNDGNGQRES